MIFLLNYERIRYEVTELTRHRMAQTLHIPVESIEVAFEKDEKGEMSSGWSLKELPKGVSAEKARETCIAIARWMKANYLAPRLVDAQRSVREARGA